MTSQINVPLLEATMSRILAEPENWNQSEWVTTDALPAGNTCGTAMCFAGHAATIDGATLISDSETCCTDQFGQRWTIREYAEEALGLPHDDSFDLFDEHNSLDDLQRKVKDLIEQAQQ